MNKIEEKIFLLKIRLKDEETFSKVYDLYVEKIYRFIFFKVSNKQEAEDLTSEVFLKAWKYVNEEKKITSLNAFLYTIARNKVIDYYRKNNKVKIIELEQSSNKILRDDGYLNQFKKLDIKIEMDNIMKFLDKLKSEYKEALLLRYVDDFSISQIAQILGKSKGNVRVLIHRALEALREIIQNSEI